MLPKATAKLSDTQHKKALSKLIRSGYSKTKAKAALSNKKNYVITYVVTYGMMGQASALTQDSLQVSIMAERSKTVRDRRNRISLRGLTPGGAYAVSWRVEISLKNPRVVLGKTKSSVNTNFTAPRG